MKCSAVIEILNQYIDGALSQEVHDSVSQHLAECEECAKEHAMLRLLICESGQLAEYEVPNSLHERVMAAVAAEKCAYTSELMSGVVDYELESAESEMVLAHIAECGACSSELKSLRTSAAAVASLGLISPPPGLRERILAATSGLRSAQPESVLARLSGLLSGAGRRTVAATAGAGFVLVVAISLMSKGPAPTGISPVVIGDGPNISRVPQVPMAALGTKTHQPSATNESVRGNETVTAELSNPEKPSGVLPVKPIIKLASTKSVGLGPHNAGRVAVKPAAIPDVAPASVANDITVAEPSGPNHSEIAAAPVAPAALARAETPTNAVVSGVVEKTAFARSASLVMANADTGKWLKSVKEARQNERNGVDFVSVKF